jgi:hypothetical protein
LDGGSGIRNDEIQLIFWDKQCGGQRSTIPKQLSSLPFLKVSKNGMLTLTRENCFPTCLATSKSEMIRTKTISLVQRSRCGVEGAVRNTEAAQRYSPTCVEGKEPCRSFAQDGTLCCAVDFSTHLGQPCFPLRTLEEDTHHVCPPFNDINGFEICRLSTTLMIVAAWLT